jgi:hypothetical protein
MVAPPTQLAMNPRCPVGAAGLEMDPADLLDQLTVSDRSADGTAPAQR